MTPRRVSVVRRGRAAWAAREGACRSHARGRRAARGSGRAGQRRWGTKSRSRPQRCVAARRAPAHLGCRHCTPPADPRCSRASGSAASPSPRQGAAAQRRTAQPTLRRRATAIRTRLFCLCARAARGWRCRTARRPASRAVAAREPAQRGAAGQRCATAPPDGRRWGGGAPREGLAAALGAAARARHVRCGCGREERGGTATAADARGRGKTRNVWHGERARCLRSDKHARGAAVKQRASCPHVRAPPRPPPLPAPALRAAAAAASFAASFCLLTCGARRDEPGAQRMRVTEAHQRARCEQQLRRRALLCSSLGFGGSGPSRAALSHAALRRRTRLSAARARMLRRRRRASAEAPSHERMRRAKRTARS